MNDLLAGRCKRASPMHFETEPDCRLTVVLFSSDYTAKPATLLHKRQNYHASNRNQHVVRRHDRICSKNTSFPTTHAIRCRWSAAKVRTCGMPKGTSYLDFFPGWGCNLLGHCPPAGRRGRAGASRHADSRAQHLVHGRARPMGPGAFRSQLWRAGVFLQLRHRSQRGGHQARPAAHAQGTLQNHHLHRRLSWPHAGRDFRHGSAEISRRARPADGRLRVCSVRRFGGGEETDRRRNRRDLGRAGAGRRGHQHSARRFSCTACASCATRTICC